jgi:hypothetical protein
MDDMREIGHRMRAEQNLTADDIVWLTLIAQAILRAFVWNAGQPMRALATSLGISPQTLYTTLRVAVQALLWVRQHKAAVATLVGQVQTLQSRLAQLEAAHSHLQAEVQRLTQALSAAQAQVSALQAEVIRLQTAWTVMQDRLIVVLKLSGRCTVRSIVEVLEYGLGLQVSVGYVQGVIAQAGLNAHTALARLLLIVPLSGAISVDEVYLKELGQRVFGVLIVDPLSGLILRLTRCADRSKATLGTVLQAFATADIKARIKLCLTDMYEGYVEPVKTYLPQAVHQFCWFHINCFHIGATVQRAERAYQRAVAALAAFDQAHPGPLAEPDRAQRLILLTAQDQAHRQWCGAQRFQRLLTRLLWSPSRAVATARLEQLLRVAPKLDNPYIQVMATFLTHHRAGLLTFYACLESGQHLLQRLSRSQQRWLALTTRWALPVTTNAAEHVFRCLRRYTHAMDHFGTDEATQRFFDLFAFFHNVHLLRAGKHAGNSLLAAAYVDVKALFGTDDPYTMLGFLPATQTFAPAKSVQSRAA